MNLHSFIVRKWINQTQNFILLNFSASVRGLEGLNKAVIYLLKLTDLFHVKTNRREMPAVMDLKLFSSENV
jgi:hypothetical protein